MKNCAVVASILLMISIGCVPIVLMSCSNEIPVYTVRFDSQVGNAIVEMTVLKGSKIAEPKSPIRDNYEFEGWYKDSDLTSAWNFISDTVTSDITLYAKWNATAYLVTYNGNGNDKGTVPLIQEKTHGINLELAVNSGDLQRTGYSFTGWNTEVDGTGIDYAEGSTYTTDVALTLYAKWTASKYSVTYDANGATDGTVPDVQSKNHGINLVLASNNNGLTKEGYSFSGWNTQADGFGTDYAEGSTYTSDGALTLYAKWVANTYSVTYDANGATRGTVPNPQSKAHGENLVLAGNEKGLERAGYSFSGWNTHSEGTGDGYLEEGTYAVDAAIILYAKWVPDTYLVTYDANGASEGAIPDSQRKYHDADLSVRANSGNLLRTGYVFTGWNTQADGSGRDYLEGGIYTSNMSLILYAKWISLHSVMFDTLGGSSIPPIEGVRYGSTIGAPDSPMKEDYIFDGWYCDNKYGDEWDFPNQTVTTDLTLYAKWLVAHTVHFDSQGGNAVSSLINVLHGEKIDEPTVSPVKAGYTFAGWYKTASYDEAWDFDNDMVDSDVTLYAKWTVACYSVVYDSRGGSSVLLTENIGYGEMLSAPVSPTRDGYVFDGWYKESETVNQWYFTFDKVVASITLYAKWLGPYVVEFDSIGGSHIPLLDAVVHGETISEPVSPARDGYKFGGWYRDTNYQNIWNFSNDAVISDITLYAKWIPIYRVSFDSQGGSPVESVDTPSGSYISAPEAPTKMGSVFGGWYKENTWKTLWQFGSYPVRSNITLYAKWLGPYVVKFDSLGGSFVSIAKNITHGERITEPETPTKNGYMFGGWYKDSEYKNEWNFVSDTVKADTTLYAKWNSLFLVSFDSRGGTGVEAVEIPSGAFLTEPIVPKKSGYIFSGWYRDMLFENEWLFGESIVDSNMVLYAKWVELHTVRFDSRGGSSVEDLIIPSGSVFKEPQKPINGNSVFGGWYKEIECLNRWNFALETVHSEITLYAKWLGPYSVNFDSQGGSSIDEIIVQWGMKLVPPERPTRKGYIFDAWYRESSYLNPWNFGQYLIVQDTTLYAKWTELYTVTFDSNGGSFVTEVVDITPGAVISKPPSPIRSDYLFIGWYEDSALTREWNFELHSVDKNLTLYASWIPINELLTPMIFVEGGVFQMGSSDSIYAIEKPVHTVTLNNFFIGTFEITQELFIRVMNRNPSWKNGLRLPVESITWFEAVGFCNALSRLDGLEEVYSIDGFKVICNWNARGYRLPTEAEWEYAARGGSFSNGYAYSGSDIIEEVAWYGDNSDYSTHPVGTKEPNELGLFDMSGNVSEWCWDTYDSNYYSISPNNNPTGPLKGEIGLLRGGGFHSDLYYLRPTTRTPHPKNDAPIVGFRVALSAH